MKQRVVIYSFFIINAIVASYSFFYDFNLEGMGVSAGNSEQVKSESFFKRINYYSMNDSKPQLDLTAAELIINESSKDLTFFEPKGVSYGADGLNLNFGSKIGSFRNKDQELELRQSAHLYTEQLDLKCENATYFILKGRADCKGNVKTKSDSAKTGDKLSVSSDEMVAYPSQELTTYKGKVEGEVRRKRKYEYPIKFKSSTARVDLLSSLVNLNDNVWLRQQGITATSQRGEIYLENYNKKLKYFVLYDDVTVKEKVIIPQQGGDKEFTRRALSEKLEGITSEDVLVLTGYPKVYQLDDVIRGNRIILRRDSELVEVEDANTLFFFKDKEDGKQ